MKLRTKSFVGFLTILAIVSLVAFTATFKVDKGLAQGSQTDSKIYLTDVGYEDASGVKTQGGELMLAENNSLDGYGDVALIDFNGNVATFAKALVFMPDAKEAKVTYALPQGANRFTAYYGALSSKGVKDFKVLVDGKEEFLDDYEYNNEEYNGIIDVEIPAGAKKLTLCATSSDGVAVYANPTVYGVGIENGADYKYLYISDLAPESKEINFYNTYAINSGYTVGETEHALKLVKNGVQTIYKKGLCIQANGKVEWDITNLNATRFTATVGVNVRQDGKGSCSFKVEINGGEAFSTQKMTATSESVDVDIDIPFGATKISLIVNDGGDGADSDNGVFANAKLYCDYVDLSDLTPIASFTDYGSIINDGAIEQGIYLYNVVREPGMTFNMPVSYDKCVFAHAASELTYDISKLRATRFTTYYGIHAKKLGSDGAWFKVIIDGREVAKAIQAQASSAGYFDIEIPANAQKLTLKIDQGGNKDSDHTMWVCPRLFANGIDSVKQISLRVEDEILTAGQTVDPQIVTADQFGNVVEKNFKYELSSSDASVLKVNADNTITAVAPGLATIYCKAYIDGFEYETEKEVVVGGQDVFALTSPDGSRAIEIALIDGYLYYTVRNGNETVVELSLMGFNTELGDLYFGLSFVEKTEVKEVNDSYEMISGKASVYYDICREQDFVFQKGETKLTVRMRAYDDGVAFRYIITPNTQSKFWLKAERTDLSVPVGSMTWSSPMPSGSGKQNTHEQIVSESVINEYGLGVTLPYMYRTPANTYVYVSEVDLDGSYAGSILRSADENTLTFSVSDQQTARIYSEGEFTSAWRAFITGDLAEVTETQMIENLADPCALEDTSWIDAGVASWSWMYGVNLFNSGVMGGSWDSVVIGTQRDPEVIKMYIDLAYDFGWEYFILDDGWQPSISLEEARNMGYTINNWNNFSKYYHGVYDWTDEIAEYAADKGIGLIAWLHTGIMDTEEKMDEVFSMLKQYGIVGIKIDFFDSEEQWIIDMYDTIYKKAAEYEIMVIVHGANKPTGERRTYPHVINREAIYGEELNNTLTAQHAINAYLRGICGPTDLTPYIYPSKGSDTTMALQMAFSTIYESGATCFASTQPQFMALSEEVKFYYKDFPSSWAETKLVAGEVGDYMTIARKTKDNERWYVGGISVEACARNVDLSFLDANRNYTAHIYMDGSANYVKTLTKNVTSNSVLSVNVKKNGGFAIVLVPEEVEYNVTVVCNGQTTTEVYNTTVFNLPDVQVEGKVLVGWNVKNRLVEPGSQIVLDGDVTVTAIFATLSTVKGASLNVTASKLGMRFDAMVGADFTSLREMRNVMSVEYGMVIAPYANSLLTANSKDAEFIGINKTVTVDTENDVTRYKTMLFGMPEENYSVKIAFRACIKVTYNDGAEYYVYADFNAEDNVRSAKDVAQMAIQDTNAGYSTEQIAALTKIANA